MGNRRDPDEVRRLNIITADYIERAMRASGPNGDSGAKFARHIGVNPTTINRRRNVRNLPTTLMSLSNLRAIATLSGVPIPADLLKNPDDSRDQSSHNGSGTGEQTETTNDTGTGMSISAKELLKLVIRSCSSIEAFDDLAYQAKVEVREERKNPQSGQTA